MSALPTEVMGLLEVAPIALMREPVTSMRSAWAQAGRAPTKRAPPSAARTPELTLDFLNM